MTANSQENEADRKEFKLSGTILCNKMRMK